MDDDDWKNVREHLYRKKTASLKRRQLEVLIRSETVRDLYHDVVESIIDLYKDSGTGLHSWQHFRAAADKLAELHKFMKLTVARVYALGTAEGAATYSYDFFEKIRDVQAHSNSPTFIPFDYLRGYLSQPDDPPPKRMRRNKRTATRRQPCYSNIKPNSSSNFLLSGSQTPACAHISSELHVCQPNPSSSARTADPGVDQCEKVQVSRSDASVPVMSNSHSPPGGETESYLSEDSSGASLCSCACADDSFTDTSSSANEEDDTDFHRGRSTSSRPTVGSTSGPPFSPSS
ncbi:hypothetical protein CSKR_113115 [Clonorchis sinensis]|uniref:Uncharacterized protein n=1 Tax=Clonorchis sinensis TaxID=79923 RepID=A0A8T1N0B5_CLOSI|nr:hypothetical protein CSKR_113115 [Clonorchis sinensis]